MTPQEAKLLAPIMAAYGDGETVQILSSSGWVDLSIDPLFNGRVQDYRIKPKPRRVPMTHEDLPPVFWVRRKGGFVQFLVYAISASGNLYFDFPATSIEPENYSGYEWSPDRKTWQDFTKEVAE